MKELKTYEFNRVIKLLNLAKVHCTFAYTVVEGKQQGKIYVDNEFISNYFSNKENHYRYFDLYSSSQEWIIKIDGILRIYGRMLITLS